MAITSSAYVNRIAAPGNLTFGEVEPDPGPITTSTTTTSTTTTSTTTTSTTTTSTTTTSTTTTSTTTTSTTTTSTTTTSTTTTTSSTTTTTTVTTTTVTTTTVTTTTVTTTTLTTTTLTTTTLTTTTLTTTPAPAYFRIKSNGTESGPYLVGEFESIVITADPACNPPYVAEWLGDTEYLNQTTGNTVDFNGSPPGSPEPGTLYIVDSYCVTTTVAPTTTPAPTTTVTTTTPMMDWYILWLNGNPQPTTKKQLSVDPTNTLNWPGTLPCDAGIKTWSTSEGTVDPSTGNSTLVDVTGIVGGSSSSPTIVYVVAACIPTTTTTTTVAPTTTPVPTTTVTTTTPSMDWYILWLNGNPQPTTKKQLSVDPTNTLNWPGTLPCDAGIKTWSTSEGTVDPSTGNSTLVDVTGITGGTFSSPTVVYVVAACIPTTTTTVAPTTTPAPTTTVTTTTESMDWYILWLNGNPQISTKNRLSIDTTNLLNWPGTLPCDAGIKTWSTSEGTVNPETGNSTIVDVSGITGGTFSSPTVVYVVAACIPTTTTTTTVAPTTTTPAPTTTVTTTTPAGN